MAESFTEQAREQAESKSSFFKREKILGAFRTRRSQITGAKFKKGTSQESADNIEQRVTANEKKITLLKKISNLRKNNQKEKVNSPLLESLQSIASTVDSIRDTLIQQQDNDKSVAESMRREKEEEERKGQEKGLESRPQILQKIADPIIKPVMGLFGRIFNFLKTLFLGKILMNFIDWFSNPANQGKIQTLVRFVKDWWPALTAAVVLFGTGFGGLVAGLIKTILFFIPAMTKAIVALNSAKFMSMIPGGGKIGAVVKTVAPLAIAGGVGYGIGRMQGGDDQQEQPQGFNKGGQVPGSGPNKDTVPAMLTPGEFVMSRGAVEQYGVGTLEGMNAAAGGTNIPTLKKVKIPQYNEGGLIMEEDLIEVNKERALQGLPPLEKLLGYDKLPYQTIGEMQKAAAYKGERTNESTNVSTNLQNMMRTVTKTVNGETTTKTYKLSNEEAEALLKKKGYPSMKLADGSVVIDAASYAYDKSVEILRNAYKNGDPEKIAQLEADPDFVEMWKSIEDGSLKKEIEFGGGIGLGGGDGGLGAITEQAKTKTLGSALRDVVLGENRKSAQDISQGMSGGGLVQGFNGGGRVTKGFGYSDENQEKAIRDKSYTDRRLVSEATETKGAVHNVYDHDGKYAFTTYGKPLGRLTREEIIEKWRNKKKNKGGGFKRMVGGAADFVTGGMFDFDKRNRKGSPKDFGINRMAGGLTDWATMGLTDFDKRGKGNLQFDPIGGGKDKAWGAADEQAKRGEKQSGMGIKRGIGGALDFMTLGAFDFDKQNPEGSPKGFGPARMLGGIADHMTMGLTDFDQRGAGNFQFNPIGGGDNKKWEIGPKKPQNAIVAYEQSVNEEQQQSQEATSDGNEIPSFTLRPDFMIDEAKVDVLGIMI